MSHSARAQSTARYPQSPKFNISRTVTKSTIDMKFVSALHIYITECWFNCISIYYLTLRAQTLVACVVALFGAAIAIPIQETSHVNTDVLQHTEIRDEAGQYSLSYLTADGIAFSEQGALKPNQAGTDNVLVKQV